MQASEYVSTINRWQQAEKGEVHLKLWPIIEALAMQASQRQEGWRKFERIYGHPYWMDNDPVGAKRQDRRMRVNRCRLHVETYVSRWMKSRVLPMVVVKGGDFGLQQKARKHNALLEGAFEALGVFDNDPKWCRDASIFGTAFAYVGEDGKNPIVMRCDPYSVLIDDLEWREGSGKTIHWVRLRPKDELIAEFPEYTKEIEGAASDDFPHVARQVRILSARQICPVVYSWSLGVGDPDEGGFKGRHVVTINGATLIDEEYDEDDLPFAIMTRTAPMECIWGEPLMADLAPVQETLDRYLKRVDESLWLSNVVRLLVRKGSKLNEQKLVNLPATILEVEDPNTDIRSHNAEISPQLMQFVEFGLKSLQELGRANVMSTTGDMPKNIRAYSAMKLLEDTDMEGLREGLRSRDSFYVRIGQLLVRAFERLGGYKLMVRSGKKAEQLNYRKIRMPANSYTWTVMPTAFLAKTAEGRMDQAEWLVDQGLLPKDRIAHFIDFPDLESETTMAMAQYDAIADRIQKIMDDGEYMSPHPFLNLKLLRKMVGDAIARAEVDNAPEERIELLRQLVVDAANLQLASGASNTPGNPMNANPQGAMQPPQQPLTAPPMPPTNQQTPPPAQGA